MSDREDTDLSDADLSDDENAANGDDEGDPEDVEASEGPAQPQQNDQTRLVGGRPIYPWWILGIFVRPRPAKTCERPLRKRVTRPREGPFCTSRRLRGTVGCRVTPSQPID